MWDANGLFYEYGMKLWENLSQELNYNVMYSPRGIINLAHSDAQMNVYARRGNDNTALGYEALYDNTTGERNTALGDNSLANNTTASDNTAVGHEAGKAITDGASNVCIGSFAGESIASGGANVCIGKDAGSEILNGGNNVCVGVHAGNQVVDLTTGGNCILLGNYSHTSATNASYQHVIGYNIQSKGNSTIYLQGNAYNTANTSAFQTTSDRRIKKNIVDNTTGLDKINQIRVRNFEYRTLDEITELDNPASAVIEKEGIQLGVIAQEIMEVLPDVVNQESDGAYGVNPDNLTWYLVNAVKELSAEVEQLKAQINN